MIHLTYISTRPETDGSVVGVVMCEECGPISKQMYLDESGPVLEALRDEHMRAHPEQRVLSV